MYSAHIEPRFNPIPMQYYLGPNDGVTRGDRADTGDEEAAPDEMGSGPAHATVDPTSFGGTTSIRHSNDMGADLGEETGGIDDLTIHDAHDPSLGLTNIDDVPADDWAADTGESRNP